jgi:heme exporter protein B
MLVAGKDVAIERATGEITSTAGFFAVLLAVLSSFAFYSGPDTAERVAPGVLWLSIAFAAILGLSRAWQREREEGALKGLVVAPIARSAIFVGKALGLATFIGIIEVLVVPVTALVFGIELGRYALGLVAIGALANVGIAASGTLFGAMTVRTRARDLVLATVLLPLLAPVLACAMAATRDLFGGTPSAELADYLELMLVFDLVFVAGGVGLFGTLIES